jgi:hypothetical protein
VLRQFLIAHGISLLVLCLVVASGVGFLYVGGPPAEISARRDEGEPITTARTILALAVGAIVLVGLNYYFARYPLHGASAVLMWPLSVIALRAMVRSGQIRNPGSGERSFKLWPVWVDVMRAVVCMIVGFALVIAYALVVHYRRLPDSVSTALLIGLPGLLIVFFGFWFLIRSSYKAVCGVATR